MELSTITTGLSDCVGGGALTLSVEYRAALQSSLVLLKAREKFSSVKLWGRISGIARDYYIAQAYGANELTDRKTFYSTDHCVSWLELPQVHPVIAKSAGKLSVRFTGNATHEYTVTEPGPAASDEPVDLPAEVAAMRTTETKDAGTEVTTKIKEDQRLAAVIGAVDRECAVVPHGSYIKKASGDIEAKASFQGLSLADAGKLQSYMHFRTPEIKRTALERAQQDKTLDFFDPVAQDVPEGCWNLQYERGGAVVVLKSLIWPGFTFFHAPGTRNFGYVYSGLGQKNLDLAFMLPSATAKRAEN